MTYPELERFRRYGLPPPQYVLMPSEVTIIRNSEDGTVVGYLWEPEPPHGLLSDPRPLTDEEAREVRARFEAASASAGSTWLRERRGERRRRLGLRWWQKEAR